MSKVGITVSKPVLAEICLIIGTVLIIFPALVSKIVVIALTLQSILLSRITRKLTAKKPTTQEYARGLQKLHNTALN